VLDSFVLTTQPRTLHPISPADATQIAQAPSTGATSPRRLENPVVPSRTGTRRTWAFTSLGLISVGKGFCCTLVQLGLFSCAPLFSSHTRPPAFHSRIMPFTLAPRRRASPPPSSCARPLSRTSIRFSKTSFTLNTALIRHHHRATSFILIHRFSPLLDLCLAYMSIIIKNPRQTSSGAGNRSPVSLFLRFRVLSGFADRLTMIRASVLLIVFPVSGLVFSVQRPLSVCLSVCRSVSLSLSLSLRLRLSSLHSYRSQNYNAADSSIGYTTEGSPNHAVR